jgi:16S rRNA (cytosine967-C5)-methyltransferase
VLAETRDVVRAVLDARSDVVLEDAAPLLPDVPDAAGPLPGTVQLWPHRHGTDAMFMALLRRSG